MIANYHTHTFRCHHATGTERQYIETGISRGLKTLGFSDHVPYPFPDGYESGYRVFKKDLPDYIETLEKLRIEYKDDIKILIGFESEYYPKYFDDMLKLIGQYDYQYLIMGQHFIDNEIDNNTYLGVPSSDLGLLHRYVCQVLEGLSTGRFAYLAHPDVLNFLGDDEEYRQEMLTLCQGCKRMNIPLEINGLGISTGRCYPSDRFFKIAAEVGCDVILGCDAHNPGAVADPETERRSLALAERTGCRLIERLANDDFNSSANIIQ